MYVMRELFEVFKLLRHEKQEMTLMVAVVLNTTSHIPRSPLLVDI